MNDGLGFMYLIAIRCICYMQTYMDIKGMWHCIEEVGDVAHVYATLDACYEDSECYVPSNIIFRIWTLNLTQVSDYIVCTNATI